LSMLTEFNLLPQLMISCRPHKFINFSEPLPLCSPSPKLGEGDRG
jgi:hypothetical protein